MAAELAGADRRRRAAGGAGTGDRRGRGRGGRAWPALVTRARQQGGQGLLRAGSRRSSPGWPWRAAGSRWPSRRRRAACAAGGARARAGRRGAGALPARPQPRRGAAAARPHRLGRRALPRAAGGEADPGAARPGPHLRLRRGRRGIGGAVAEAMGRVLAEVRAGRQVICITHLPQMAAFADATTGSRSGSAGGRTTLGGRRRSAGRTSGARRWRGCWPGPR